MKKNKIRALALVLSGAMLFGGCGIWEKYKQLGDMEAKLSSLEAENAGAESASATTADPGVHDSYGQGTEEEAESSAEASIEETVVTEEQAAVQKQFDAVCDEFLTKSLQGAGINVHDLAEHPEEYGVTITDYVLYDHSEDEDDIEDDTITWFADQIKDFAVEDLTMQQQILYDKVMYEKEINDKYGDVTVFDTQLSTNKGLLNNLSILFYEYRFLEEKDVEEYLKYLQDVPASLDDLVQWAQESIDDGYAPTDDMLQTNIDVLEQLCEKDNNPLLDGFVEKLEASGLFDADQIQVYQKENEQIVEETLVPAFQKTREVLESWVGKMPELKGLCQYEGGDDYYDYLVELYTGAGMNAEELNAYLSEKMSDYVEAMYSILYSDMSVLNSYLNDEYDFPYEDPQKILEELAAHAAEEFPEMTDPGATVSYLPKVMEIDGVLAYYVTPQIDVDATNVVRLNGSALNQMSGLYSTLGHESYPGHLFAYNYIKQQNAHPANQIFSYLGYGEGWAEFASSISMNWWGLDENLVKLLQIDELSGQIMTGIIDTGVNGLGWGIDEIADVLEEYYGMDATSSETKEAAQSYYDFVTDTPGVILSYSAGHLQVIDLRNKVKEAMGSAYTPKAFYEAFLNVGETPFYLTEKYVMKQIEK